MFEHVASTDPITRILQDVYTHTFWSRATLGCEVRRSSEHTQQSANISQLNRPCGLWMKDIGGWEHVSILRPEIETASFLLPHDIAVFVKASYASMAHT